MNPLDNATFIKELGLQKLSKEQQAEVFKAFVELIQIRVADALTANMTDEELARLDLSLVGKGEPEAIAELQTAFPQYSQVRDQVIKETVANLKQNTATILATVQSNGT